MKGTTPDLTRISKYISLILRHKPEVIGIQLDAHGWADVNALLAGISKKYPIEPAGELTHAVRVHRQIRDGLLDGQNSFSVSGLSGAALWVFFILQSHPPFAQRPAG